MITENKPLTIATEQKYDIVRIEIQKDVMSNKWFSVVYYNILNEDNNIVKSASISYQNEEFNTWNTDWTSDAFLYQDLIRKLNLETTADGVDENFQN